MENFVYHTPTKLMFGKDVVKKLPDVLRPLGRKVLLTYGGGSIKKIGLYDEVKRLLSDFEVYELSGIEPNPKYTTSVCSGVKLCKEHGIDVILAVGGGSVMDASKAIALAIKNGETPFTGVEISSITIYKAIHRGRVPGVTDADLPLGRRRPAPRKSRLCRRPAQQTG